MKNLFFLFLFSLLFNFELKAQVMHSSSAMEYSIGVERFSQFIAPNDDFLILEGRILTEAETSESFRLRPSFTARYKNFKDSGNYTGMGVLLGTSRWQEEVRILTPTSTFPPTGQPEFLNVIEVNNDTRFGLFYQYSFLLNKDKGSNLQFFMGGEANVYGTFSSKVPTEFFLSTSVRRNIIGGRISLMPEMTYLIPNSRVTLSLRLITPLFDLQNIREEFRQSTLSSFSASSIIKNNFDLAPFGRSRLEFGFGYFLKSK